MRILHINSNYIYSFLHNNMVVELNKLGIINDVVVPTYYKNKNFSHKKNAIIIECFNKIDKFLFYYKQKKIVDAILKRINMLNYECIHAHTLFTDGNCAMKLSKKFGVPYIVAVRNTDVNDFFKKRIFLSNRGNEILKNASAVIFLSESYKKIVINNFVKNKYKKLILEKTHVIPNGIDNFWFENKVLKNIKECGDRINNKKIKLLFVGDIDRNKNTSQIVQALKHLRKENFDLHLTIIGKPVNKRIVEKLRFEKNVLILPIMKKEELLFKYREADIFVMISRKETFGLVYAEALSQHLPVLYTKGQGFDQQFEDGFVGFSVKYGSTIDLVNAIKKICNDYQRIVTNCSEASNCFQWFFICQKYLEIYNSITKKNSFY